MAIADGGSAEEPRACSGSLQRRQSSFSIHTVHIDCRVSRVSHVLPSHVHVHRALHASGSTEQYPSLTTYKVRERQRSIVRLLRAIEPRCIGCLYAPHYVRVTVSAPSYSSVVVVCSDVSAPVRTGGYSWKIASLAFCLTIRPERILIIVERHPETSCYSLPIPHEVLCDLPNDHSSLSQTTMIAGNCDVTWSSIFL